jgi:hypothetical protein
MWRLRLLFFLRQLLFPGFRNSFCLCFFINLRSVLAFGDPFINGFLGKSPATTDPNSRDYTFCRVLEDSNLMLKSRNALSGVR